MTRSANQTSIKSQAAEVVDVKTGNLLFSSNWQQLELKKSFPSLHSCKDD